MKKNIILKISKVRDSQARLGLEVGRSEDWLEDSSGGGGDILRWTISFLLIVHIMLILETWLHYEDIAFKYPW